MHAATPSTSTRGHLKKEPHLTSSELAPELALLVNDGANANTNKRWSGASHSPWLFVHSFAQDTRICGSECGVTIVGADSHRVLVSLISCATVTRQSTARSVHRLSVRAQTPAPARSAAPCARLSGAMVLARARPRSPIRQQPAASANHSTRYRRDGKTATDRRDGRTARCLKPRVKQRGPLVVAAGTFVAVCRAPTSAVRMRWHGCSQRETRSGGQPGALLVLVQVASTAPPAPLLNIAFASHIVVARCVLLLEPAG